MNILSGHKARRSYLVALGSIAAFGVVASMSAATTTNLRVDSTTTGGERVGPEGDAHVKDKAGHDDSKVRKVPCDADELISALVKANAGDGGVLELEEQCTYTLTAFEDGIGLPEIVRPITILGNGATIVRAANAARFRIFRVAVGGDLTLVDLTVKGGDADTEDGGGLLVEEGGEATVVNSDFTLNRADDGGAIANYGITTITGDHPDARRHDDDSGKDGARRPDKDDRPDDARKHGRGFNEFTRNVAATFGGALYNEGHLRVADARISDNNAALDAGGIENIDGTLVVKNTLVDHNTAGRDSGGVDSFDGLTTLEDSVVSDNTAGRDGGGVGALGATNLSLESTKVVDNTAGRHGGGLVVSGGSDLVVDRGTINDNTALDGFGGGIFIGDGDVVLRRSEVDRNRAVDENGQAGGINVESEGSLSLTVTEVDENFAVNAPGGIRSVSDNVTVDDESEIIRNRPTNCEGSPAEIPNCFG